MRLSLLVHSLAGGGAERMMVNLAGALAGRGLRVDLVAFRAEGPYLPLVPAAVRLVDLGAARIRAALPATAGYLRRERPDAVLATMVVPNLVALLARRLARVSTRVVVRQDIHAASDGAHARSWQLAWAYRLIPVCYPWADGVVAISRGVADDLVEGNGIPRSRIRTIYNPVVTPDIPARAAEPAGHPWLEPGRPPVVLGVGRLAPQKGFATLLRAFAEVRRRRPARLVILGDGPLRPELEALAGELGVGGDVALPGFVANPYAWMSRAALLALSSVWEALPTVLIEALACGTPVVATDCPSGPCEILDGGRFGRLVPVGDPEALAGAIDATLDRPADPEQSRRRAQDFAVGPITEHYLDALLGH